MAMYIAGALARDLWLELAYSYCTGTGRRTADIDFAVACADRAAFHILRAPYWRRVVGWWGPPAVAPATPCPPKNLSSPSPA